MAKKEKHSFRIAPWNAPKRFLTDFIQVKPVMLKNVIVKGRILYFFKSVGNEVIYRGAITVQPLFTKGQWSIENMPWVRSPRYYTVTFPEDQNYEEVKASNRAIIEGAVNIGELYIKQSDPILKFNLNQ